MRWLAMFGLVACGRIGIDAVDDGNGNGDGGGDVRDGLRYAFDLDSMQDHRLSGETGTNVDAYAWNTASVITVPGVLGNGVHFDGTESVGFALFPAVDTNCIVPAAITGSLTVATWVRFDVFHDWSTYSLSDIAVMYGSNGGLDGGWGLGATNGCGAATVGFTLTEPMQSPRFVRCGATSLVTDRWYFVAGVYDASARTGTVYVDGVLDTGAQANANPVPTVLPSVMDACVQLATGSNQMKNLTGSLDEVRVYDRALSGAEIAKLYRFLGGS